MKLLLKNIFISKTTLFIIGCGIFLFNYISTFSQYKKEYKNELIQKDSSKKTTKIDSTVVKKDSVKINIPLKTHGSFFQLKHNIFEKVTKNDLQWMDYTSLFDILKQKLPAYPLSLGNYGQFNNLSIFGGNPHDNNLRFNNRQMNDIAYGSYNLEQFSPEFIQSAEIMIGSDAVIFANNASGAAINLQEIKYNTSTPYSKLWFSQSGYGYISSDGIYSQNFAPNLNFTFGFKKQSSAPEFTNQWFDGWHIRGLLRWNPSNYTSISLTENFVNHSLGTNGGVNNNSYMYDPLSATVKFSQLDEHVFRHDITLSFSSIFDSLALSAISGNIYVTNAEWNRTRSLQMITDISDSSLRAKYFSRVFGANAQYEQKITELFTLRFGGELSYIVLDKSYFNDKTHGINLGMFGHLNIKLMDKLNLSGGIRLNNQIDRVYNSIGAKINYQQTDTTSYFADLSISQRPPSPAEGLKLNNETNTLFLAGLITKFSTNSFSGNLYLRHVDSPILSEYLVDTLSSNIYPISFNGSTKFATGMSFSLLSELSRKITFSGKLLVDYTANSSKFDFLKPNILFNISSYYDIKVSISEVRIGFEFETFYRHNWDIFIPQTRTYQQIDNDPKFFINGLNFFAYGKFGNTYVKIMIKNVIESSIPAQPGYYYTAYYPELGRLLRISLSWPFLD